MKNIKTFLVIVALLLSATVSGHDFCIDGVCYSITSNEELIVQVSYQGSSYNEFKNEYSGTVVIPNKVTYNGKEYSVTSIGHSAFSGCSGLTSVTIPNSVTSIGDKAFLTCRGLANVSIPNSVTSIGEYVFYDCSALTSIIIPNSVTSIGEFAFCRSGLVNIDIPNSVTSIGGDAFCYCFSLTSVTIGNSVTSIGEYAFSKCHALTNINIPKSVTSIEDNTFQDCSSLVSIIIPDSVVNIKEWAFYGCSSLTSITIPNSVISIGDEAFCGCSGLTNVIIGNSVTSIGDDAFSGCSGLTSVVIPNSVTSIGNYGPFNGCTSLANVTIPNSVTSIGQNAFRGCTSLTSITIPNSVTSIGQNAFRDCSGLTSMIIPNSVTSISVNAFRGCSGLTSVIIPNSVTSMGTGTFRDCKGLTKVTIGNSLISIGDYAFQDCSAITSVIIGNSVSTIGIQAFSGCSSMTSVDLPNSVTSINREAFWGCSNLTHIFIPDSVTTIGQQAFSGCLSVASIKVSPENVVFDSRNSCNAIIERRTSKLVVGCRNTIIPDSIISIGDYAFEGHTELGVVDIPNTVISIGDDVFKGCTKLANVIIGKSLENIGDNVFDDCLWLKNVTCYATVPPTVGSFKTGTFDYANLYVPYGSKSTYETFKCWSTFGNIEEMSPYPISEIAAFNIETVKVGPNDSFIMPIEMKNDSILTAFQCDIYVPEGITLQKNSKGKYDITLDSERSDDHTISTALQPDGSVRVVVVSMTSAPLFGTEGPLFHLNLLAGEELGTYTIDVKNISVSDAAGNLYNLPNVSGTIEVYYKPGDANGDGSVLVNDVVYTVNRILGIEADDFIFRAADMNGDGNILVNDVVMIVNTILGTNTTTAALAPRHMNAFETLSVADSRTAYGMTEFGITLSNASRYTAMQFDMELTEGADIADIKVSMPTDHSVAYRRIDDTTVRVVVTSLTNEALAEGTQLCISMKDAAGKTVAFTDGRAACNNGQMVGIMPGSTVLGGTTGIEGVNAEFAPADVYSIDGRIVKNNATTLDGLKPSVYVVNGRKVVKS